MITELYPYQARIRDAVIDSGDTAIGLFMKMGTGKTVTSLSLFEYWRAQGFVDKLLVICLKCKIEDWNNDIEKEFIGNVPEYRAINFESVWRPKRAMEYTNFVADRTMIIIDESHKMKSHSSKITNYLLDIYNRTKFKLILTGTPQSQEYIDYYPQMRFINSLDFDMPYKRWEKIYVNKKLDESGGHYFYVIDSYNFPGTMDEAIAKKAYYHEYESQYEMPIEIHQDIQHSKDAIKFQKDRVWKDPDEERGFDIIADTQMGLRTYMRQSCSGFIKDYDIESPKEEWLRDFLEIENSRVVIFTNYIHEIERIREVCKKLNRPVGVYYGAEKDLKPFKDNENGIAIVNYQSGAVGINDLCIANIGIFYGPPEDYILFIQAKARIDRIGQTKQPVFYYLQTKGSVEKAIYESLKKGEDFDIHMFEAWLSLQKR